MTDDVQAMADEVAQLMAQRLGGARRGARPDLATMLRRRGGALPRRQRRAAQLLARTQAQAGIPKVARQIDTRRAARAHADLVRYLRPLGKAARWQAGALNLAAAVMFGLMLLAAGVLWVLVWRGFV
ncbi:hypothetical protein [Paracoccus luteus]|uniref:hypothetical protein n=1 Tax=Paracoccus luteus TaxID=2508543 RepID=UPI001FE52DD1|nr:hypothetical protein [Paracoccus luteus]